MLNINDQPIKPVDMQRENSFYADESNQSTPRKMVDNPIVAKFSQCKI